jgi:hypothetical protein
MNLQHQRRVRGRIRVVGNLVDDVVSEIDHDEPVLDA